MGLVRKQKIGEGMFIHGKGKNIEITLLEIGGMEFHRKVKLAIEGIENLSFLELYADRGYFYLADDIKLRVSNGSDYKKDGKGNSVFMDYDAPKKDYKMDRKEFKDNEMEREKFKDKKEILEDSDEQPAWIVNANHPIGFYYKEEWKRVKQKS